MIEYRVSFEVYDTDDGTYAPIYKDRSTMSVTTLRSVDDKPAFTTLCNILLANVAPEGSTVIARKELVETPAVAVVEPAS